MADPWEHREMGRDWPVEALSAWAAHVVALVESRGGNSFSAYSSLYELADTLGMWEPAHTRRPGHVWSERDLQSARRRVAHLIEAMREASNLIPQHPAWIAIQLVDLLSTAVALPHLNAREVERRVQYAHLNGTIGRLVQSRFDVELAPLGLEAGDDERRPATADESIHGLMDTEHVRPRTMQELADDLQEEAARSFLPRRVSEALMEIAGLVRAGSLEPLPRRLEWAEELLLDEIDRLGDFRVALGNEPACGNAW